MAYVVTRERKYGTKYTGMYFDPEGIRRSAGTFPTRRDALRAAQREEQQVLAGRWHDRTLGSVTFRKYVETDWFPSRQIEPSTRAAYASYLNAHFLPYFGDKPMGKINRSTVEDWIAHAATGGLSPRSIRKYHTVLHSIFKRAVRDGIIVTNPCDHTELPKVVARRSKTLTPEEFAVLLKAIPDEHRLMVETAIETGMRWGELIALRPRHIDFLRQTLSVEDTIVELSRKASPTGERYLHKPYPKDNEPRTFAVRQDWLDAIAAHITIHDIGRDDLLFTTDAGTPISRNNFRGRVWLPAVKASGVSFHVRMHDLRHAHASWLLAGGSDLKSVMERMGHSQIQTTQRYLHALPEADQRNIDALNKMQGR